MNRLRENRIKRLGASLAIAGLLFQFVLALVHVPPAFASDLATSKLSQKTKQIETVICAAHGTMRVLVDVIVDDSDAGDERVPGEVDTQTNCPVCFSLGHLSGALLPDFAFSVGPEITLSVRYSVSEFRRISNPYAWSHARGPPSQA